MKPIPKNRINVIIGLGSSFPAAYFILIHLLNEFGYSQLLETALPILQDMGIEEPRGWNFKLLFLVGPILALFLNVQTVLRLRSAISSDSFDVRLSITKHWWNFVVIVISGSILMFLACYGILENCNCSKLFRVTGSLEDEMFRMTFRGI